MKTMLIVLIVLVIMSLSSPVYAFRHGNRPSHSPPQEAIDVCINKSEPDTCKFVSPHGDTITGTCEMIQNQLACKPEVGPPPQSGQNRNHSGE